MKAVWIVAIFLLASCTSVKLSLVPPPDVDLSGQWALNEADSDDAQRLIQSQHERAPLGSASSGRERGTRRGGEASGTAVIAPAIPAAGAVGEALRWPGKQLRIAQTTETITFQSGGHDVIYRPTAAALNAPVRPPHGRADGTPLKCGWDERAFVIETGDADDDAPFDERFSVSGDKQRLIEVIGFRGRSSGFTISRVWDRTAWR